MREVQDIQNPFACWLDKQGIPYHRSRTDRRTTSVLGDPDFLLCLDGKCLYLEAKLPGKKLSPVQQKRVAYLLGTGNPVKVCYSLEECISAVQTWLGQKNELAGNSGRSRGHLWVVFENGSSCIRCKTNVPKGKPKPIDVCPEAFNNIGQDLRGVGGSRPESEGLAPERIATSQQQVAGGFRDPPSQNNLPVSVQTESDGTMSHLNPAVSRPGGEAQESTSAKLPDGSQPSGSCGGQPLFILNILGNNWLCKGDRSHGGTAERVRRASADDLREYR